MGTIVPALNRRWFSSFSGIAIFSSALYLVSPSDAVPLSIVNAGFETPTLSDNQFSNNIMPGWTGTDLRSDSFGVWNPPSDMFPAESPEGLNVGFLERGAVFQTLPHLLVPNTAYLLTLSVGQNARTSDTFYVVELLAGATVLASVGSPDPGPGEFVPISLSYTALASNIQLGQPLQIRIRTDDLAEDGSEISFDGVRLDANPAPVPQPATLALVVGSLATACFPAGWQLGSLTSARPKERKGTEGRCRNSATSRGHSS